jgi:anti-sigma B factor antagonist
MHMQDATPHLGLRCHVERVGDVVVVRPVGELDLATIDAVREPLDANHADGAGPVVLDLRSVTFMDSTGLRLVVHEHRRAGAGGLRVQVAAGSAVHRLLVLTGLLAVLPIDLAG